MKTEHKIAILVGDGMADYPIKELGNKTPLEAARTPNMDNLAKKGILGLAKTVPRGMAPGSDTANLSLFGYDPKKYFTGRSPLEALNMGLSMNSNDVSFRCNLVNIDKDNIMADFSANHIETKFTELVINELRKNIDIEGIELYPGVSYRNILIWRNYPFKEITLTTPPHDIQGQNVIDFVPKGDGAEMLNRITRMSQEIIRDSELIKNKKQKFKGEPTSAWLWGGGVKPNMESLKNRFGLHGYTISAVDLIHGIGKAIGLSPKHVDGVTGYLDTNYKGKADALIEALKTSNFVFLHVESPDESGHEGNVEHKIKAIEDFDKKVVGRVFKGLRRFDNYTMLVISDHPTPISLKTHTSDPVPFCIFSNQPFPLPEYNRDKLTGYNEKSAKSTGLVIKEGHTLIEAMIAREI